MEEQGQPGEMNTVAEYNVLFDSVGIQSVSCFWMMS